MLSAIFIAARDKKKKIYLVLTTSKSCIRTDTKPLLANDNTVMMLLSLNAVGDTVACVQRVGDPDSWHTRRTRRKDGRNRVVAFGGRNWMTWTRIIVY